MDSRLKKSTVDMMFEELEKTLLALGIDLSKCDFLEHTLLNLADVRGYGDCRYNYYDSRINFSIGKIASPDAKKFMQYFHLKGDQSAKITYAYFKEGDIDNLLEQEGGLRHVVHRKQVVTFDVDGEKFCQNIYPLLKTRIADMALNPLLLKPYQNNKNDIDELCNISLASNSATLFSSNNLISGSQQNEKNKSNQEFLPSTETPRYQSN